MLFRWWPSLNKISAVFKNEEKKSKGQKNYCRSRFYSLALNCPLILKRQIRPRLVFLPNNALWDTLSTTTWAEELPIFHSEDFPLPVSPNWMGVLIYWRGPSGHKHFKNESPRAKTKEAMWIKTLWSWEILPLLFVYAETLKKLRSSVCCLLFLPPSLLLLLLLVQDSVYLWTHLISWY